MPRLLLSLFTACFVACASTTASDATEGDASSPAAPAPSSTGSSAGPVPSGPSEDGGRDGGAAVADPNLDGPFAIEERDARVTVDATKDDVAIHAAYPKTGTAHPVVLFGHGFQLSPALYVGYLKRLASFGYVAVAVDFPAALTGMNNPNQATDLLAGIDWAKKTLSDVDDTRVGATGHSLGGKIALLAANRDARIKAAIVLDPVDGGNGSCSPPGCVTVADLLPQMQKPTAFLGETVDATGGFQSCAPADKNFLTFYAKASSPSFYADIAGANHMSFLDDAAQCGFVCSFCNQATAANADVNALSKAYVVAFYERHLRLDSNYDTYLTGALAKSRYVTTKQITLVSK